MLLTAQGLRPPRFWRKNGFTLVELIVVIMILAILAAVAFPRFGQMNTDSRAAAVKALGGSITTAMGMVKGITTIRGAGSPSTIAGITFVKFDAGTQVRVWNGYPDRWCDGIGVMLQGLSVPASGCYLSSAAIVGDRFTFYGYGNSAIPGGDAGWRIESAPTPMQCSVQYTYGGTGTPVVKVNTSGC